MLDLFDNKFKLYSIIYDDCLESSAVCGRVKSNGNTCHVIKKQDGLYFECENYKIIFCEIYHFYELKYRTPTSMNNFYRFII